MLREIPVSSLLLAFWDQACPVGGVSSNQTVYNNWAQVSESHPLIQPSDLHSVMARYVLDPALRFPHHTFTADEPRGEVVHVSADLALPVENPGASDMGSVPVLLREAGVTNILLVHGTFVGGDIIGIVREVRRFSPVSAKRLDQLGKAWFDELVGDVGNYTDQYSRQLGDLINPASLPPIQVERFGWSGENHHIGRADGAVALVNKLASMEHQGRILVMAHSHGANLLAMLSQIAGGAAHSTEAFFKATRLHYHSPLRSKVDLQDWTLAREVLLDSGSHRRPIDIATFGAPLRYRWNREICPRLLHVIQHRIVDQASPAKALIPRGIGDVTSAVGGDYVQHLAISGTDFLPSFFAWRDLIVERRLRRLFEATSRRRDVIRKLKQGRRESSDGKTLLVDYPNTAAQENQKLFGHGIYTSAKWLPFHLRSICQHLYDVDAAAVADPG